MLRGRCIAHPPQLRWVARFGDRSNSGVLADQQTPRTTSRGEVDATSSLLASWCLLLRPNNSKTGLKSSTRAAQEAVVGAEMGSLIRTGSAELVRAKSAEHRDMR